MNTKAKTPRSRKQATAKIKGEIVSFDVFTSEDPFEAGKESKKESLGQITYSESYLKDAAHQFGGDAYYYFLPRHADGSFGTGKTLFCPRIDDGIEDAYIEEEPIETPDSINNIRRIIREEMGSRQPQNGHPPSSIIELVTAMKELKRMTAEDEPKDKTGELIGTLRSYEEIRKLFTPRDQNPRPVIEDRPLTTEQALLKLIAEDPIALAEARNRILGGDGESFNFVQVLPAIIPALERIVSSIADAFRRPAPGTMPTQANEQATPLPANAGPAPQQAQAQARAGDIEAQGYARLFNAFLQAMAINGDVKPVVEVLDSFAVLFPEHAQLIEGLMNQPAEAVIQFLGQAIPQSSQIVQAPHAIEWIQKLQAAYLEGSDGQAEGENHEK